MLDRSLAAQLAGVALGHVEREYPNHIMHLLRGPEDIAGPRTLHPIFFGSFDWHSCVHSYWLLARVLERFPDLPEAERIRELLVRRITPEAVAGELAYFEVPGRETFERPYGWAWLLQLVAELAGGHDPATQRAAGILAPLATFIAERFAEYWPRQTYPIRTGTHYNSAFAMVLALEYAERFERPALAAVLRERAGQWFAGDADCQAWEPGGDEFLSPTLIEALCMQRMLPAAEFPRWLERFLPQLAERRPATLFEPAIVSDRSDGKIAHLDGLNLSRAWCWRSLAAALSDDDPRRAVVLESAGTHLDSALVHIDGDYMGAHWLATFALLALER